eukprot:TRINITY_DN10569_c0_g1_i1.p1 TRINITY_DN10569_c0_g1~~TRINITY_DN10569_c0_g1_i1.p1  ORF type:complete len:158 (-),score=29.82 TRINITY_DN10569_c0_g1_i1:407-880(-)
MEEEDLLKRDIQTELENMGLSPLIYVDIQHTSCSHIDDMHNVDLVLHHSNNNDKNLVVESIEKQTRGGVIVILSLIYHAMPIFMLGGRICPFTIFLISHPSFLFKPKTDSMKGNLLLKKGYTFDEKGQCFLVEFSQEKQPRVKYFVNHLTRPSYCEK